MWRAFPFLFLTSVALAACGGGGDGSATRNATLPATTTSTTTLAATTTTTTTTTLAATTTTSAAVEEAAEVDGTGLDDYGSGRAMGIAYGGDAAYGYDAAYGGDCAYGYERVGDYDCLFGRYYISAESGSVVLAMSVFFTLTLLGGMGTMAWQALRREEA
ncbi:MAG: hypothetical protein QF796_08940 [Acidimicrobiales bacterium]|nr:hypothetical protein [Acidimicrobiales bacterium]